MESTEAESKIADMIFGEEEQPIEQEQPVTEEVEQDGEVAASEDETPDDSPEASDTDEIEYIELELDGKLYEVPKDIEAHFMRQKDYTQKTQELSAQRKEAEAIQAQVQQERAKYEFLESVQTEMQEAEQLKAQIEQVNNYKRENIDSLDYKDMIKLDAAKEEYQSQLNALGQSLQAKQTEFQQAQEQSIQELLDKSTEALKSKIPNWGEQTQREVRDFALKSGFSEQELNNVYDPRYVETLYKAAQYDKLKSGATAAVQKVQEAPSIKPKARNPMPEDVKRKLNLRKKIKSDSVSNQDKANLVGLDIAERFNM